MSTIPRGARQIYQHNPNSPPDVSAQSQHEGGPKAPHGQVFVIETNSWQELVREQTKPDIAANQLCLFLFHSFVAFLVHNMFSRQLFLLICSLCAKVILVQFRHLLAYGNTCGTPEYVPNPMRILRYLAQFQEQIPAM